MDKEAISKLQDELQIVGKEMDAVWNFHPDNPNGVNIKEYHSGLQKRWKEVNECLLQNG